MPLWGSATDSWINKAQIVLNTAARWVTGLNKRTKITVLMESTGWMTIREQIRAATALLTWKTINYSKPQRLKDRWQIDQELKIEINRPRLQFAETCLRWRGPMEWNQLDAELRKDKSINCFKRRLKRQILDERDWDPGDVPESINLDVSS